MERAKRHAIAKQILAAYDKCVVADYGEESWETDIGRFTDQARFEREKQKLFLERPQFIAVTGDLPNPGDYYATDIAGKPILLVRGKDGKVNAFLNACRHRGVKLAEGCGHAARFTCPYHGWTFGTDGALVGVPSRESFDEDQLKARGLISLPVAEDIGMIVVHPQPDGELDFDAFLGPMKEYLADYDIAEYRPVRTHRAPAKLNWKHAVDGGMEAYHTPFLHANTFGTAGMSYLPHLQFGDHHALIAPTMDMLKLKEIPEEEWPHLAYFSSTNAIFPNTVIGGGNPLMYFQRSEPGDKVGESTYIFRVYGRKDPTPLEAEMLEKLADLFWQVSFQEDLPAQLSLQETMEAGAVPSLLFGKREILLTKMHKAYDRAIGHNAAGSVKDAAE
jgi:phenylpropionate dioxygenase-like ring-hydroxylating dioxygenase large terminal subunit